MRLLSHIVCFFFFFEYWFITSLPFSGLLWQHGTCPTASHQTTTMMPSNNNRTISIVSSMPWMPWGTTKRHSTFTEWTIRHGNSDTLPRRRTSKWKSSTLASRCGQRTTSKSWPSEQSRRRRRRRRLHQELLLLALRTVVQEERNNNHNNSASHHLQQRRPPLRSSPMSVASPWRRTRTPICYHLYPNNNLESKQQLLLRKHHYEHDNFRHINRLLYPQIWRRFRWAF